MKEALSKLLTPDEVANILGVTKGTLHVWRSRGSYSLRYVKVGDRVMYAPDDVARFIEERTFTQTGG